MIGFSTVAEPIFCRIPPSGCLGALLERKRMKKKNEIKYFYRNQSDILLCGIAGISWGNKNKLRTFQPQTKFTGSYQKKECINSHLRI